MAEIRLQKYLSELGIASRREAETWIKEGRIALNGEKVTVLGTKINPETDRLSVNGKPVQPTKVPPKVYWLLHKPDLVLTARPDESSDKQTIYDLPKLAKNKFLVSPVGRLDYRTEGLLLLTNDGDLNYRLSRPEFHVPREYQVLSSEKLTPEQLGIIKKGFELEDGPVKNIKIEFVHGVNLGQSKGSWYMVTVHEGRNRLVRRIFEYFNSKVVRLIRVGFGDLRLTPELKPGEYRQLTPSEISNLKRSAKMES
jgi:23S rRNA pseudouridine2605 synthase